jgi:hypothetical protein
MPRNPARTVATVRRAAELAADARAGIVRYRDPAERLRRRQRRARWGVGIRTAPTVVIGGVAGQAIVAGDTVAGGCLAAVAAGGVWATGVSLRHAWRLHRTPVPASEPRRPPRSSAARGAIDRLDAQQIALGQLVGLLGGSGTETAATAGEASVALRRCAARVVAIEATPGGHPASDPAVAALVTRLDAGVTAHAQLVRAAAAAVAASSGVPDAFTLQRVEDETDRLRGLALGLAEVDPGR